MHAGVAVDQAINAHKYSRSSSLVFQAIDPGAVFVGLLDSHGQSVAHGLQQCNEHQCSVFVASNVELSGPQRQDARPGLAKMYRVAPGRAWWPAVGAPLERRVRPRWG